MIDREHILPKGKRNHPALTFEVWNLSVSCKRCNMQFKGEDVSFIVNVSDDTFFKHSHNYLLIHPNFDRWEAHLHRKMEQENQSVLVIISVIGDSAKGRYTYQYFGLNRLEVDSFTDVQRGVENRAGDDSALVAAVKNVAEIYGQ